MSTTETIFVENIKCGGCIKSIKEALPQIAGVSAVMVDKDKESVEVTGSDSQFGSDAGSYPTVKQFYIGVNLGF